jgi:hypothetical protein
MHYNFYMHMNQVISSHSEYITPYAVMIYATSDAIRVTPL